MKAACQLHFQCLRNPRFLQAPLKKYTYLFSPDTMATAVENGNSHWYDAKVANDDDDNEITSGNTQEVEIPPHKNPGSLRYNAGASAEDTFSLEALGADFADYVEVPLGDDLEEVFPEIDYSIVKKYVDEVRLNIQAYGVRAASNFPIYSVPSFTDALDNLVRCINSGGVNAEEVKALVRKCLTVLEKKGHKSYYSAALYTKEKHQQQFDMLVKFLWRELKNFDFSLETDKLTADTIMHLLGSVNDDKVRQGVSLQQKFLGVNEILLPARILLLSEATKVVAAATAVGTKVVAAADEAPSSSEEEDLKVLLDRVRSEKVFALTRAANAEAQQHAQIQLYEKLMIDFQELQSRLKADLPEHKQTSAL